MLSPVRSNFAQIRRSSLNADGKISGEPCGAVAQLGERIVRNDEVVGSIPTSSTNIYAGSFDLAQDFGRELACLLRRLD